MYKIHLGGKRLCFANLPKEVQDRLLTKARQQSPELDELARQGAVNIKIDGKLATQEWVDQLDLDKPEIPRTGTIKPKKTTTKPKGVIQREKKTNREKELYGLTRDQQFEILVNRYKYKWKDVPNLEKDRVKEIIRLEKKEEVNQKWH